METFSVKILDKILNEVPEGKTYTIELGERRTIKQFNEYSEQYQFGHTDYRYQEEVIKAVVHNGCIELHLNYKTYSIFNSRESKIKDETYIEFIPFSQITTIRYSDAEQL